jgi:hypothetical protein
MEPHGDILVGPGTLAVNEQLRMEAFAGGRYSGARIATDVFVWARGEAPNPAMTKIGGLPYRPKSIPWPLDDQEMPIRFIGQVCFADSRDIVGDLAGDVLLIFGDDDALLAEPERLVLEWSDLGIGDLITEIPRTASEPLTPCYGWSSSASVLSGNKSLEGSFGTTSAGSINMWLPLSNRRFGAFYHIM